MFPEWNKCKGGARFREGLCEFFSSFHSAINAIATPDVEEARKRKGKAKLVERGRKALHTALNGVGMRQEPKQLMLGIYNDKVKADDIDFDVKQVGMSVDVGVYVPGLGGTKDWIQRAEEAQEAAKVMKGKNKVRVYYEKRVLPSDGTKAVFEPSVSKYSSRPQPRLPALAAIAFLGKQVMSALLLRHDNEHAFADLPPTEFHVAVHVRKITTCSASSSCSSCR